MDNLDVAFKSYPFFNSVFDQFRKEHYNRITIEQVKFVIDIINASKMTPGVFQYNIITDENTDKPGFIIVENVVTDTKYYMTDIGELYFFFNAILDVIQTTDA